MGKVTAGLPIEAIEDIEGYVPVSENVRRGRELFALRIQGDSMINAGILDGDIVVVNREQTAENGEIVRRQSSGFTKRTDIIACSRKTRIMSRLSFPSAQFSAG